MASYFSPDLFLENVCLVVIYLKDGHITLVPEYDSKGRIHESGDLINLFRDCSDEERNAREPAIILGCGECTADAIKHSRNYFRRLAKWHGHTADLSEFQLLGYDFTQSEFFQNIQEHSDSEEDSANVSGTRSKRKRENHSSSAVPRPKKNRRSNE